MKNEIIKSRKETIIELHAAIEDSLRTSLGKALICGSLLCQQKEELPHGEFIPWIKENLPMISVRTCQKYMNLHRNQELIKCESPSHLEAAYRLLLAGPTETEEEKEARTQELHECEEEIKRGLQKLHDAGVIDALKNIERRYFENEEENFEKFCHEKFGLEPFLLRFGMEARIAG